MFYLLEIVLYKWLVADILGEPWIFWTAMAIALVIIAVKSLID